MLTNKGRKEALHIKKRHLLWEVFLVDKLGYEWEDVHEEAEILEHITSEKLEKLLEKYLEYPKVCPHGTPLEDDSYIFCTRSLDSAEKNIDIIISRLEDEKDLLKFSKLKGLNIGDSIKILDKNPDGTIGIEKDGKAIEIDEVFAKKIYVK